MVAISKFCFRMGPSYRSFNPQIFCWVQANMRQTSEGCVAGRSCSKGPLKQIFMHVRLDIVEAQHVRWPDDEVHCYRSTILSLALLFPTLASWWRIDPWQSTDVLHIINVSRPLLPISFRLSMNSQAPQMNLLQPHTDIFGHCFASFEIVYATNSDISMRRTCLISQSLQNKQDYLLWSAPVFLKPHFNIYINLIFAQIHRAFVRQNDQMNTTKSFKNQVINGGNRNTTFYNTFYNTLWMPHCGAFVIELPDWRHSLRM